MTTESTTGPRTRFPDAHWRNRPARFAALRRRRAANKAARVARRRNRA